MRDAREVALDVVLAAVPNVTSAHEWMAQEATTIIEAYRRAAQLEVLAELERRVAFELRMSHTATHAWALDHTLASLRSELEKAGGG